MKFVISSEPFKIKYSGFDENINQLFSNMNKWRKTYLSSVTVKRMRTKTLHNFCTCVFFSNEPHEFISHMLRTANVSFLFIRSCFWRAILCNHKNLGIVAEIVTEIWYMYNKFYENYIFLGWIFGTWCLVSLGRTLKKDSFNGDIVLKVVTHIEKGLFFHVKIVLTLCNY